MRCLARNKQPFKYCLYAGKGELIVDGLDTGEKVVQYEEPIQAFAPISASKGSDSIELFGVAVDYDKTITIDDMGCPIDENTLVFIDKEPKWDESTKTIKEQDYIITRIAKTLNVITIAVKKVKTNGTI